MERQKQEASKPEEMLAKNAADGDVHEGGAVAGSSQNRAFEEGKDFKKEQSWESKDAKEEINHINNAIFISYVAAPSIGVREE